MADSETPEPARPRAPVELLASLVDQVSDYSIVALDPQGTIVSWNAGAEEVRGYSAAEAVGTSFARFYTTADRRRGVPMQLLDEARELGHTRSSGWRVRKDGTHFWADVVINALHDAEGRLTGFANITRDLTAQHDLEERLRESEERLRLLVGQVVDYAIIALDPQGTIEPWNRGAERLKGYTEQQAVGRSFAMFYAPEDQRAGLPARLLATARDRGRVESSGWRMRRDGTRFWADVTITALRDAGGALTGYAKVTRDRTDVKRLEEAQDSFYATFTHDFRTPVTVIKGFVEALRDVDDDPELRDQLLDRVEASTDRLLSMVQGLVDFAKQRVDHADVMVDDIDVAAVAAQAVAALGTHVTGGRVEVEQTVALARANGEAMTRVVTNLVMNALRYSAAPSEVRVGFARRGDHLELSVTDHGRGIHEDDVGSIFEQFERGRYATDDGGSGLGLASVRDLVQQQDGEVEVTSTVGEGTCFVIRLKASLRIPPAPRAVAGQVTSDEQSGRAGGSEGLAT